MLALKPQDIVLALKLCEYPVRPPMARLAAELGMSVSEIHAGIKRAGQAGLVYGSGIHQKPNVSALEEFLLHGVKYAFPAQLGGPTRGIPTAHAAPPLNERIAPGQDPLPVWPVADGHQRGVAFEPLYKSVPIAVRNDRFLYQCLALVDAIRAGRARERRLAETELSALLRGCGAQRQ